MEFTFRNIYQGAKMRFKGRSETYAPKQLGRIGWGQIDFSPPKFASKPTKIDKSSNITI